MHYLDDTNEFSTTNSSNLKWIIDLDFFNSSVSNNYGIVASNFSDTHSSIYYLSLINTDGKELRYISLDTYRHIKSTQTRRYYSSYYFSGDYSPSSIYTAYVLYYYPYSDQIGCWLRFYAFSTNDAERIASHQLSQQDDLTSLYCAGPEHCFATRIASKGGDLIYIEADSTGYDANFSSTTNFSATLGTPALKDIEIIHLTSSTVTGAGSGNRMLYMLSSDGEIFNMPLNNDGSPATDAKIKKIGTTNTSLSFNTGRIHLKNDGNDELYVTGTEKHIFVLKKRHTAPSACCRQSLQ